MCQGVKATCAKAGQPERENNRRSLCLLLRSDTSISGGVADDLYLIFTHVGESEPTSSYVDVLLSFRTINAKLDFLNLPFKSEFTAIFCYLG